MIEQLQFSLRTAETPRLPSAWAYRIYGWLMAQLPADTAARLHEQGEHPLSQSLCFDAAAQTSVWTLNLLDEALAAQVRPLLAGCTTLELHGAPLQMEPLGSHSVETACSFCWLRGRSLPAGQGCGSAPPAPSSRRDATPSTRRNSCCCRALCCTGTPPFRIAS